MDTSTVVRHAQGVLCSELDGEAVLLDPASGRYFGLNPVGAAIWTRLDGKATLDDVLCSLEARYEAPTEVLRQDLVALVEELLRKGLLEAAREREERHDRVDLLGRVSHAGNGG